MAAVWNQHEVINFNLAPAASLKRFSNTRRERRRSPSRKNNFQAIGRFLSSAPSVALSTVTASSERFRTGFQTHQENLTSERLPQATSPAPQTLTSSMSSITRNLPLRLAASNPSAVVAVDQVSTPVERTIPATTITPNPSPPLIPQISLEETTPAVSAMPSTPPSMPTPYIAGPPTPSTSPPSPSTDLAPRDSPSPELRRVRTRLQRRIFAIHPPSRPISTPEGVAFLPRRSLEDAAGCPICMEEIHSAEDAVWCRVQCGQNMHRECFMEWKGQCERGSRGVTCPYCRRGWIWCRWE